MASASHPQQEQERLSCGRNPDDKGKQTEPDDTLLLRYGEVCIP